MNDRQTRIVSNLLRFLPLVLIITMFGMAVLVDRIAPDYEVIVGEGAGRFRLTTESMACSRIGDTATCTAPVGGQQLTVEIGYYDATSVLSSDCTAQHGNRMVPCSREVIDSEVFVTLIRISDQLGVTEPELTRLWDAVSWWWTGGEPSVAAMTLLGGLVSAASGVTTFLLNKRARPQAATWRSPVAVGTGFLALVLLIAGCRVITSYEATLYILAVSPATVASAAVGAWQYQLGGAGGHGRARRWIYATGATVVTALYIATFYLLLFGGFLD